MTRRTGPAFALSPSVQSIEDKSNQLALYGEDLYGTTAEARSKNLVKRAAQHCGRPETNDIVELALGFEEDIAIMHNGKLAAICFCFPSSWIPRERLGLSLADIHRPVADSENLVSSSDRIANIMSDPTFVGFERSVWTLTNNSGSSNHPRNRVQKIPNSLEDLYFRLETQTTEPLGDGLSSLFFVRVDVVPLLDIWEQHGPAICASVHSMSDAILDYKNLRHIKTLL